MKVSEMNWSHVEDWLKQSDLAVLPLGSTEQHAGLSLSVDSILSEKVALDAAEPLGVPVFPVVPYGLTPYFLGYPGTVSLRIETYSRVVRDILDSLRDRQRPRRKCACGRACDRMDGRQSRLRSEVPQLVERAQDLRQGARDRHGRLACVVDGEFPMDAVKGRRDARTAQADDRP